MKVEGGTVAVRFQKLRNWVFPLELFFKMSWYDTGKKEIVLCPNHPITRIFKINMGRILAHEVSHAIYDFGEHKPPYTLNGTQGIYTKMIHNFKWWLYDLKDEIQAMKFAGKHKDKYLKLYNILYKKWQFNDSILYIK